MKTMGTVRRAAGVVVLSTLVVIAGAEAVARYGLGLGDPPLSIADPDIEYLFKPGSYHRFGNRMYVNTWHMRSDEFPAEKEIDSEFRVMVFGDSVINGGALTDQADLATEILRGKLAAALARPVVVGNISAGSWGPTNMLEYARKFGFFQADVVVIMLNSMDIGDNPSGRPVVGVDPAFPARRPLSALHELFRRYFWPRLHQFVDWAAGESGTEVEPAADRQAETTKSVEDIKELCRLASSTGALVLIAHFPSRGELAGGLLGDFALIAKTANDLKVPFVEMRDALFRSFAAGNDPYRPNDPIHADAIGQRVIADVLSSAIVANPTSP